MGQVLCVVTESHSNKVEQSDAPSNLLGNQPCLGMAKGCDRLLAVTRSDLTGLGG
jgi:hypothetical protein